MKRRTYRIDELCTMAKGAYPTLKTEPGEYPLVVTAAQRRTSRTYQLEGPAVCVPLISSTGHGDAALHRIHYQEGKFALANLLVALLPKEAEVSNAKYLYYLLTAKKEEYLVSRMFGTANVSLKVSDIASVEVALPGISEQRRIVARIEELAAKIEEARGLRREALDEAEQLVAAEEMRIWPDESLRGTPCLEDVTAYLSRGRQSKQGVSDHYLIKTQHVQMGRYVTSEMTLAPDIAAKVRPEATVRPGDVLIACSAAGCLGRVAHYAECGRVASTDTHVAIARADSSLIMPEYLYAYLKGAQGQHQLRSRERGDWMREKVGFRLTELNLADLKRVPVPVPSEREQRRILAHLDDLRAKTNTLNRLQAETAAELDAMLPAILDKAFKGEL